MRSKGTGHLSPMALATIFFTLFIGLLKGIPAPGAGPESPASTPNPKAFAIQKLHDVGATEDFVRLVTSLYTDDDRDKIVEMNVLGFLAHGDYDAHYSKKALRKCRTFMDRYSGSLRRAQTLYNVSREVLTALLWVETKHGRTLGNTNVPQVYFSLLQADHPDVLKSTLSALELKSPNASDAFREKARKRSEEKAAWALVQLEALEEIYHRNSKRVSSLNGSYAGAFGIPQFIPTSYLKWARTRSKPSSPDLFRMADAIESAAFYLHSNGWNDRDPSSQRNALFHYNRSEDYVRVILKIAAALHVPTQRELAGRKRRH